MRHILILNFILLGFAFPGYVQAQAFCALRDPVGAIYELLPEANRFRSITKEITEQNRAFVSERLPFSLHRRELGKHTLYVALKDGSPIGLVHSRSEKGQWGLVEVVWAFDLDLRVEGFLFQRCRDKGQDELLKSDFTRLIKGAGFEELRGMLSREGQFSLEGGSRVSEEVQKLAATVLRSGLKTILVTRNVWKADLEKLLLPSDRPGKRTFTAVNQTKQ